MPYKLVLRELSRTSRLVRAFLSDPGTIIILVLSLVVFSMFAYSTYSRLKLATQTHSALCEFKNSIIIDKNKGLKFLELSPAQRIKIYGEALGSIPPSVIKKSVADQEKRINALSDLQCEPPQL